jgi:glycosyltransferase involved in cell wall biosynthesis
MGAPVSVSERPVVSVIVPARNEEACLGACLESLVAQDGVGLEIIVVDDGSTDRTRSIAESFVGVQVIEPGPLPAGWSGKNNAVAAGAKRARGEWLLFTDADTVHRQGSLARALAEAREHQADLLSYSPEQEVHGFWERAVMPVIFAELARKYPPSEVSDFSTNMAAANGQYLLISREVYDAVGGHAAIGHSLLEDVALARAVKESGHRIRFRYGGDAVRTRMYRNFTQLREGWTKNLSLLFASPILLAAGRALEFLLVVACLVFSAIFAAAGDWRYTLLCLVFPAMTVMRIATAHFSWASNLLGILGLPFFSYLLVRSKLLHKWGRVSWKGRTYAGDVARVSPVS